VTVDVVLAVASEGEDAIAAAIAAHPDLRLARRCVDLAEALAAASAGGAHAAVVSPQPHLDRVTAADFAQMGVRVVGVWGSESEQGMLAALGIPSVAASEPGDVIDALLVAPQPEPARETTAGDAEGAIVAVWGPTGAPGRTTIAVNLAASLARTSDVLLLDLDTYGASVAQALALSDESPGVAAIARAAALGTLDTEFVLRQSLRVGPRLRVMTGLTRAARWRELAPAALDAAWPVVRAATSITVLDVGFGLDFDEAAALDSRAPQRDGAARAALAVADVIVAVGSSEPHALQRLITDLDLLNQVTPGARTSTLVVVNRVRSSVAGRAPERQVADVLARFAGVSRVWTVPWDGRVADEATLRGATWAECAPRAASTRAIASVAAAVLERLPELADTPTTSRTPAPAVTE